MSVNFDSNYSFNGHPEWTFVEKWVDSIYEGCLKQRMSSENYCRRAWVLQTGTSPDLATKVFLEACRKECLEYKEIIRASEKLS